MNADCRYCHRYNRPCGRDHTAQTRSDWARTWDGRETPLADADRARGKAAAARVFAESAAERDRYAF